VFLTAMQLPLQISLHLSCTEAKEGFNISLTEITRTSLALKNSLINKNLSHFSYFKKKKKGKVKGRGKEGHNNI